MAKPTVKLNSSGVKQVLQSEWMRKQVAEAGEAVAETVSGMIEGHTWTDVDVSEHTSDRRVYRIVIDGANAGIYQIRDGVFTKAATMHGLEMKEGS